MKLTVLVTGGAGYIGSHTCKALSSAGFHPITIDNLIYGHEWSVRWGPLVKGNILDRKLLNGVFETYKPLAVLHFAAFAYVGESVLDPGKYYHNNVAGTISLLETMRNHGCNRIVFSSTCATYGIPEMLPIPENHSQKPINPYGWSKLMIEQILRDYDSAYGIRYASLRYFNAAGADPACEIGEDHNPETHLIPLAIQTALGQRPFLEIFGTDYPTPDGTAIRDFIHVTDLAKVHVLALQSLLEKEGSMSLNLGSGKGCSVREVVNTVELASNKVVSVQESPRRKGDPPILIAEPSMALQKLGWQPCFTDLQDIIKTALQWHSSSKTCRRIECG